jgi:hypothetical protein
MNTLPKSEISKCRQLWRASPPDAQIILSSRFAFAINLAACDPKRLDRGCALETWNHPSGQHVADAKILFFTLLALLLT